MTAATQADPGGWRSRTTFVLALSASAVGLGNLWRFSYLAGEHGGGVFVLTYVLCLFLVAVPVMVAEVVRFGLDNGDIAAAKAFLFNVRPVDFTPQAALVALGQAFYTLAVGVGTGISYGAYAPRRTPIGRSVVTVAVFDTVIALLAGLAVFPLVFASNLEPSMGPGLVFFSVPYAFGNIVQGDLFGALFFLLFVLAALGSAVAIMEPAVGSLIEMTRLHRLLAVLLVGAIIWLLGLAVALSLVGESVFTGYGTGGSLLGFLDALTADCLLPLVALMTAVLVGWRLRRELLAAALERESPLFFSLWRTLLRYIAPAAMLLIMLSAFVAARG